MPGGVPHLLRKDPSAFVTLSTHARTVTASPGNSGFKNFDRSQPVVKKAASKKSVNSSAT